MEGGSGINCDLRGVEALFQLINSDNFMIRFQAAKEGYVRSKSWVDNSEDPKFGIIAFDANAYLFGEPTKIKAEGFLECLRSVAKWVEMDESHGSRLKALRFVDSRMVISLQGLHGFGNVGLTERVYLECSERAKSACTRVEDYTIEEITLPLIERNEFWGLPKFREECEPRMNSVSRGGEPFIGCGAFRDGELVGWCLAEYISSAGYELGIEVLFQHRNKGIARSLTNSVLEAAEIRHLRKAGWHCYSNNYASLNTALSCGFRAAFRYYECLI